MGETSWQFGGNADDVSLEPVCRVSCRPIGSGPSAWPLSVLHTCPPISERASSRRFQRQLLLSRLEISFARLKMAADTIVAGLKRATSPVP